MSKYNPLWEHVSSCSQDTLTLDYGQIESVLGFPIDHSFLTFKKELSQYGWEVVKISMKARTVLFRRIEK